MKHLVADFKPSGGKHCITTAIKQIFDYYHYPLTEEMIFGIGSGLSFVYVNLDKSPMVSGRTKPFEFERKLGERLNIDIKCKSSGQCQNAFIKTKDMIRQNKPVLVYVDMPYLEYLQLDEDNHFGGHAVVIFGYDDDLEQFYISDRDNADRAIRTPNGVIAKDFHLVDYESVERARSSKYRPFPANNKYLDIHFNGHTLITSSLIIESIKDTCEHMLNAPAKLLGLNGIHKFAKEIVKWSKFDEEKLKKAGVTNYFQINADGGTGGGAFRRMYGDFLLQASEIIGSEEMKTIGECFIMISEKWDEVANDMWQLGETADKDLLPKMAETINVIHKKETSYFNRLNRIVEQEG